MAGQGMAGTMEKTMDKLTTADALLRTLDKLTIAKQSIRDAIAALEKGHTGPWLLDKLQRELEQL